MKITDLALLFVIICTPFILVNEIQQDRLAYVLYRNIELDHVIDTAVEDGVALLVDVDEQGMTINKERAVDSFLQTMCLNLDLLHNNQSKQMLMHFIPVIAIIDYDGLQLYSYTSYSNDSNEKRMESIWYPKTFYTYSNEDKIYFFTLDDYIEIYDLKDDTLIKGRQKDLKVSYNDSIIGNDGRFDEVRRRTIIQIIEETVGFHIKQHNQYAASFGIEYQFNLPVIEKDDWNNTIDDVSMLVFIQGLPIGKHGEVYNNYAIGGARILKKEKYFLAVSDNGIGYYHRSNCKEINDFQLMLDDQKACALEGYYPCHICQP